VDFSEARRVLEINVLKEKKDEVESEMGKMFEDRQVYL
jgi:hypothetical protein